MTKRILRGITWDHPRGYDCLAKNTATFTAAHPDVEVVWEKRSLKAFGDAPIDVLAESYDLIVIDHPFSGHAHASGCLLDLRPHLSVGEVDTMLADSVGKSAASYHYEGGIYGLPTDAAAQVASYRPDLLAQLGATVPRTFDEVLDLAERARHAGRWIAVPACPTDAACLVFTFSANRGTPLAEDSPTFLDGDVLDGVLADLEMLVGVSHPQSVAWNPIRTYETMTGSDDIIYCPFGFGYSNYARSGRQPLILFADVAGPGPDPKAGAILGGAGMSITASCSDTDAALNYLRFVHDPEHQRGAYFDAGGQPGSRTAWLDPRVNTEANGFFGSTLETLDKSYLRPRWDGFIPFFEAAGEIVNARLCGALGRDEAITKLSQRYDELRAANQD